MAFEFSLIHLQKIKGTKQEFLLRFFIEENIKVEIPSMMFFYLLTDFGLLNLVIFRKYNNLEPISNEHLSEDSTKTEVKAYQVVKLRRCKNIFIHNFT